MKSKHILFWSALLLFSGVFGQNHYSMDSIADYDNAYDKAHYFYQGLDHNLRQSNLFITQGLPAVAYQGFTGLANADSAYAIHIRTLWQSVYHGLDNTTMLDYSTWVNSLLPTTDNSPHALSVIYANYDAIKTEFDSAEVAALNTTEPLTITNNQLHLAADLYPFEHGTLFLAGCPEIDIEHHQKFAFPLSAFYSNKGELNAFNLTINFNDGQGWLPLSVSMELEAQYKTAGYKTATVKLMQNGQAQYAYLTLNLNTSAIPNLQKDNIRDEFWNDPNSTAIAYQYFRDNHDGTLHKPVIFVEGLDYLGSFDERNLYSTLNNYPNNQYGLLWELNDAGHDVILLDFRSDNTRSIQQNAEVLRRLINHINAVKTGDEKLVVAGASMGGLVSRYCLANMEQTNCEDHNVRLYISYDTPHQGANVPVSLQWLTKTFNSATLGFVPDFRKNWNGLNSPAARQMLLHHVQDGIGPTSDFQSFYQELNQLGYPIKCRNIAVSLGNTQQNTYLPSSGYGSPANGGDRLLDWQKSVNRGGGMVIDTYARAIHQNAGSNVKIAKTKMFFRQKIKFLFVNWTIDSPSLIDRTFDYWQGDNTDYLPGGFINTQEQVAAAINEFDKTIDVGSASNPYGRKNHTIVPTWSSIDFKGNKNTLNQFSTTNFDAQTNTPFDRVIFYTAAYNYDHAGNLRNFNTASGTSFISDVLNEITNPQCFSDVPETLNTAFIANSDNLDVINSTRVESNGELFINPGLVASGCNSSGIGTAHYQVSVLYCDMVNIETNGLLQLGNAAGTYTTELTFDNNSSLVLDNASEVVINSGSSLIISNDATLEVSAGTKFTIQPGGELRVNGNWIQHSGNEAITLEGGGLLRLEGANELKVSTTDVININDASQLLIGKKATCAFSGDEGLFLNGLNSTFKVEGTITLAQNAAFTYGSTSSTQGHIILNPKNGKELINAPAGGKVILPGNGLNLIVEADSWLDYQALGEFNYVDEFSATNNAVVMINNNADFLISCPKLTLENSFFHHGRLFINRLSGQGRNFEYEHSVTKCEFNDMEVHYNDNRVSPPSGFLKIEDCDFKAKSGLIWDVGNVIVYNSRFKQGSYVKSKNSFYKTKIAHCEFTGTRNTTAIKNYSGQMILRNNRISNYINGINNEQSSYLTLTCNTITDNEAGIFHSYKSDINTATGVIVSLDGSNNYIANNESSAIYFKYGNEIPLDKERYKFYPKYPGVNGNLFYGTYFSAQCFSDGVTANYWANNNMWDKNSSYFKPSDYTNEIDLEAIYIDRNNNCKECSTRVIDNAPMPFKGCEKSIVIDIKPPIPDTLYGSMPCPSCPILITEDIKLKSLDDAAEYALSQSEPFGGNNNVYALELIRQIFKFQYLVKNEEIFSFLQQLYFESMNIVAHARNENVLVTYLDKMDQISDSFLAGDWGTLMANANINNQLRYAWYLAGIVDMDRLENRLTFIENTFSDDYSAAKAQEIRAYAGIMSDMVNGVTDPDDGIDSIAGLSGVGIKFLLDKLACGRLASRAGLMRKPSNNENHTFNEATSTKIKFDWKQESSFNLNVVSAFTGVVVIYDSKGSKIMSRTFNDYDEARRINHTSLPSGIYIVTFVGSSGEQQAQSDRIMIE